MIMMKKTVQGLMALAILLLSAGAAQARDLAKDLQFDVFALGGASTFVDAGYFDAAGRKYHSRFDLGPKFTLGVAVPYGKFLSIETAFSTGPNDLIVTNTNVFPHVGVQYPVRVYMGSLSAVVHAPFSFRHLRPYAEAGVDYDRFSPTPQAQTTGKNQGFAAVSTANITHNDKLGFSMGFGVDRKILKRVTLRLDVRDHISSSPAFGLPPEPTGDSAAYFPVPGRAYNIVYTAGVLFHFGKH